MLRRKLTVDEITVLYGLIAMVLAIPLLRISGISWSHAVWGGVAIACVIVLFAHMLSRLHPRL